MANIKIMNYAGETFDTGVSIESVECVDVTVMSGDELINIYLKSGEEKYFDSAYLLNSPRFASFYEGSYSVKVKRLEEWNNRESTSWYDNNKYEDD